VTITDSTIDSPASPTPSGGNGKRTPHVKVAIIGTGFSGLGMAIRLQQSGVDDFLLFDRADEVGGTWRDNSYPGAECDVMALLYSFSFAQNPNWSKTFGTRDELFTYLKDLTDRFRLRPHIRFKHEVVSAEWDDEAKIWRIATTAGDYTSQVLVTGTGYLSDPVVPNIPGLTDFQGTMFHSSRWDHDYELEGKKVAVIGTGASALQFVPKIQPKVGELHVHQRTPAWIGPKSDKPTSKLKGWMFRKVPGYQSFRRGFNQWGREVLAFMMTRPPIAEKTLGGMTAKHLQKSVADPELRAKLTPDYTVGCKRMLFSNYYYPAIQADNAQLITDGITQVGPNSITTADGTTRDVDAIILATGFAATERPFAARITGKDGLTLGKEWAENGMTGYRGTTVSGFPNLFMLLGPGTTLGHSSQTVMIEAQLNYVLDALKVIDARGLASVEVHADAQAAFTEKLGKLQEGTVWTAGGCASWYQDAHGRNPSIWPTYTWRFRKETKKFDLEAYQVTTLIGEQSPITAQA